MSLQSPLRDVVCEYAIESHNPELDATAFVSVHSLRLGPALGGTRIRAYGSDREAFLEGANLARAMTRKASVANLPLGGGKGVINVADPNFPQNQSDPRRPALFKWYGELVERARGDYITCEDSGASTEDMVYVREATAHVVGLPESMGGYGDPSPYTARGVFLSIELVAKNDLERTVDSLTVSVQGVGHVGAHVARQLHAAGAKVVIADVHAGRCQELANELGSRVEICDADRIREASADIFCPCAFGGVVDEDYAMTSQVKAVVGAANNQLSSAGAGHILQERGIVYGPDYVVNAGGLILMAGEALKWRLSKVDEYIAQIPHNLARVLREAAESGEGIPETANRIADARVAAG